MKRGLVMAALLGLNAWAGACSYDPSPNKGRRIWWNDVLTERGLDKQGIDLTLADVDWNYLPYFPDQNAKNIMDCAEINDQIPQKEMFEKTICEAVNLRPTTAKALLTSAYNGKLSTSSKGYLFRFTGGAGSQIPGKLWSGTQVSMIRQSDKTILVWQLLKAPVAADRLNHYLEERMGNFFVSNRDYWRSQKPMRDCAYFGIKDTEFARFSECFVSSVDNSSSSGGQLFFKLSHSSDETLDINTYYALIEAGTCGSIIDLADKTLIDYFRSAK